MRDLSWFYLYGVGGLIYALGSIACARTGALDFKIPSERRMFLVLTVCLVVFALFHGVFQFVLPFVE